MDFAKLRAQLLIDEGKRLAVYRDLGGFLTVGVGHLVLAADHLRYGDTITDDQCAAYLRADMETAYRGCVLLWEAFDTYPDEVQQILCNMAFNLGRKKLSYFVHLRGAVLRHDWRGAAEAMQTSRWYEQVGHRSQRLVARMRHVAATAGDEAGH